MSRRPLVAAALAGTLALGLAACSASAESKGYAKDADTLVFGIVPDTTTSGSTYEPIADYLEEVTGKKIVIAKSSDYSALINASVAGKVDVATFSGFTYVVAEKMGAKISPVAGIVTEEGKDPGYYSEAIVPKDSPIDSLEGFRGQDVCLVDPGSTSGYLWPSAMLLDVGIDPEKDITPLFAGKHDAVVDKVADARECAAGFAESMVVTGRDDVKVVHREFVPGMPIVVSDDLPSDVRGKLAEALAGATPDDMVAAGAAEADTDVFRKAVISLAPVDDSYYDVVRDICEKIGSDKCQA